LDLRTLRKPQGRAERSPVLCARTLARALHAPCGLPPIQAPIATIHPGRAGVRSPCAEFFTVFSLSSQDCPRSDIGALLAKPARLTWPQAMRGMRPNMERRPTVSDTRLSRVIRPPALSRFTAWLLATFLFMTSLSSAFVDGATGAGPHGRATTTHHITAPV